VGWDSLLHTYIAALCGSQPKPGERSRFSGSFPALIHCQWSITSGADPSYNCIAWSVDETNIWYDSVGGTCNHAAGYCCIDYDSEFGNNDHTLTTAEMDTFYSKKKGYTGSGSGASDAQVMYYSGFHAARKKNCSCGKGQWIMYESKCGNAERIEHIYDQLDNSTLGYGSRTRYYK